jgi:hypothetical protein
VEKEGMENDEPVDGAVEKDDDVENDGVAENDRFVENVGFVERVGAGAVDKDDPEREDVENDDAVENAGAEKDIAEKDEVVGKADEDDEFEENIEGCVPEKMEGWVPGAKIDCVPAGGVKIEGKEEGVEDALGVGIDGPDFDPEAIGLGGV